MHNDSVEAMYIRVIMKFNVREWILLYINGHMYSFTLGLGIFYTVTEHKHNMVMQKKLMLKQHTTCPRVLVTPILQLNDLSDVIYAI